MPLTRTCPKCCEALPPDAPSGFCPKCLFRLGAAEALQAAPAGAPSAPAIGPLADREPPSCEMRSFGDYELLEEIARGGMGVVYKARQISLNRFVAIKMLLGGALATPDFVRRFRTEASAAAVLHHPHIVAIHEVGVQAGQHYFSMDFVEGPNLAKLVGHQPLAAGRAARYARLIAEAIEHAHQQGILHRDLKPSNVLIDSNDQPRITDFGLAKRLDTESSLTLSGQVLGSPSFMPPEQAGGKRDKVGRPSDVYGLGGILYYLLTARPPFQADSLETIVSQVLNAEPVSPRLLNPTVPRDLETICLKCLEKEARRRYTTAQELADELGRFLEHKPILARPLGPTGKVWRWCRRKPVVAGLAAALLGACLLGLGGVLWQWQRAERHAQRETQQRRRVEDQTRLAEARELQARKNEYIADMNLAQHALAMNNLGRSRALLEKYLPGQPQESEAGSLAGPKSSANPSPKAEVDLRDWEWRYLWPLCQSDALSTLLQHSNSIVSLAFSRAGGLLAARETGPGSVLLWDWSKRQQVWQLPGTWGGGRAMALSPQGQLLAVGGLVTNRQAVVNVWETSTRRQIAELQHGEWLVAMAFSPDGSKLATFAADRTVRVWNMETRQLMASFTSSPASGEHRGVVAFSPDGAILAIGETDGRIRLVALISNSERRSFQAHAEGITALAFAADGKTLASGSGHSDSTIRLWDVESGSPAGQLVGHTAWVSCLALSPDGRTLASASADQTIRLWELASQRCQATLRGHLNEVYTVAFSPDGQALVSGCKDGSVGLWDPQSKPKAALPFTLSRPIRRLEFAPDSQTFNTLNTDGSISLWDTATAKETLTYTTLGTNHNSLAISPDGTLLAVGCRGRIRLWHRVTQRELTNFVGHSAEIVHLQFRAQGRLLLSAGYDWRVKVWETTSWREQRRFPIDRDRYLLKMDASVDGRLLAIGDKQGTANVWDTATGSKAATLSGPSRPIDGVAFSPNGRLLAVGTQHGTAKLYEVNSWRELTTLHGHLLGIHSVAFTPDGQRLATGSNLKEAVKLWDIGTGQEVCTLEGEGTIFQFTAFSPDGNTLVSVSRQGAAHFWRAPSLAEIDRAEKEKLKHP